MINDLIVDGIGLVIGSRSILNDLSFSIRPKTIHGLLGPNGAGKSSTFKIIAGLLTPDSGFVRYGDLALPKEKLGFTIEEPIFYPDLTTKEFLFFLATLRKCPGAKKRVDEILEKFKLTKVANRLIGHLSSGYKQRIAIAQSLLHNPEIIILDEPTNGLDPQSKLEMREIVRELKNDHTVLISSHLLHEMGQICDDVTIISEGRVLVTGPLKNIQKELNKWSQLCLKIKGQDQRFLDTLEEQSYIKEISHGIEGELQLIIDSFEDHRHEIIKLSFQYEVELVEIFYTQKNLEDIFMQVTESHV